MNNMDECTTKNMLKMMYDGKIRKITDKCLLLPDKSLFNLETSEIISFEESIYRLEGYANKKFICLSYRLGKKIYNESGKLLIKIADSAKPNIYKISSCEFIIISEDFIYVYNSNIQAITKQLKYTNVFIDATKRKVDITYLHDNKLHIIKLDITM